MAESKYCTAPIGQKFHRWTVLGYSHSRMQVSERKAPERIHYWLCRCDCGTERSVTARQLGKAKKPSQSCGCLTRERVAIGNKLHNSTHGMSKSREHQAWAGMKQRCLDPNWPGRHNYSGRGITVCERWASSFESFYHDIGTRPSDAHSLDRIDNDGNYSCGQCDQCVTNGWPMNARWATKSEQVRNTRRTQWVEYQGERAPLIEWCERLNISLKRTDSRLARGWSVKDAFTLPDLTYGTLSVGSSPDHRKRVYK